MSLTQVIEAVQQLPDGDLMLLKNIVLEQEKKRHLKPKRVIYMDLRENLPEPVLLSPEEEEKLYP
jgi:predicted phosphatase